MHWKALAVCPHFTSSGCTEGKGMGSKQTAGRCSTCKATACSTVSSVTPCNKGKLHILPTAVTNLTASRFQSSNEVKELRRSRQLSPSTLTKMSSHAATWPDFRWIIWLFLRCRLLQDCIPDHHSAERSSRNHARGRLPLPVVTLSSRHAAR